MSTTTAPDVHSLDPVEDSPLLRLPKETRKEMLANGKAKPFIEVAIDQYIEKNCPEIYKDKINAVKKPARERLILYYDVVRKAFVAYDVDKSQDGGFAAYAGKILNREYRHMQETKAHEQKSLAPIDFKKASKLRKILEYLATQGLTEQDLYSDKALRKSVVDAFGITFKSLDEMLRSKNMVVSLDKPVNDDDANGQTLADVLDIEDETSRVSPEWAEPQFRRILTIMGLLDNRQKEKHRKRFGLCWSEYLLEYLRCNAENLDTKQKKEFGEESPAQRALREKEERLARCNSLAPLDENGCLWDVMLCMDYVAYIVAAPLPDRQLPPIATNPLVDPAKPPSRTVLAEYCGGKSASAVSQQMKEFRKMLCKLLEQVPAYE